MEAVEKELTAAEIAGMGNLKMVTLPSGHYVKIREQNGEDDDILSNPLTAQTGDNFSHFICAIIVETDLTPTGKLNLKTIKEMKLRDKYVIILASRIHSLGETIYFHYDWGKPTGQHKYGEDLNTFIWDYQTEFPFKGMPGYHPYRAQPYMNGSETHRELDLKSGKKVRWRYLTVGDERGLLDKPLESKTKNLDLRIRDLELLVDGVWIRVENFKSFNLREMMEMRNDVKTFDTDFMPLTDIKNPSTGETVEYPIIGTTDFFYPEEI